MSLINQMLKDLDARRSDTPDTAGLQATPIRAVAERRRVHPAGLAAVVVGLSLAGAGVWWWGANMTSLPLAATSVAAPAVPVQEPPAMPATVKADEPEAPVVQSEPATLAAIEPEVQPSPVMAAVSTTESVTESGAVVVEAPVMPMAQIATQAEPAKPVMVPVADTKSVTPSAPARKPAAPALLPSPSSQGVQVAQSARAEAKGPVKHVQELTPSQRAENEYRRATRVLQQGRTEEALNLLDQALLLDARHSAARQAKIALLLELRRSDEAFNLASEGVALHPQNANLAMILARLQVDRGALQAAIATLEKTLSYAADRADYLAFLAALLQRDAQHKQAVEYYLLALRQAPHSAVWWMGLGISLQAEQRNREAQEAFTRAKTGATLSPELLAFVEQRLSQLRMLQ